MSFILAIETSHARGSVAVVQEDGAVAYEKTFTSERSHNSQVFAPLSEALEIAAGSLQALVVGTGPGSYTGARIGIAAAQGIAVSRHVPVFGLPSVLAPDASELPAAFTVCGDARRGMYFIASIHSDTLLGEIVLHETGDFAQRRAADSATPWFTFDAKIAADFPDVRLTAPSATRLAQIASRLSPEHLLTLADSPKLEPLYLAAPFITMPKQA
jgi:tRNA threonylcarbamoyl adenosine modification protein YeaZ